MERELRKALRKIYSQALEAVDPEIAVRTFLKSESFDHYSKIYLAGFGKAAVPMAKAVEEILDGRLESGMVTVKDGHGGHLEKTTVFEASHPEPDKRGVEASVEITRFLREKLQRNDLLILVVSGGGSALFPMPVEGLSLRDKQITTSALIRCGATIQEINAIRKHLSRVKGGRLLEFTDPASVLTLVLSDVISDDFSSIASGPTTGDPTTFQQCLSIINSYAIESELPAKVLDYLKRGAAGGPEAPSETPKPGDSCFEWVRNILVANNFHGLKAASVEARNLGFEPLILSSSIPGETRDVAAVHVAIADEVLRTGNPLPKPCCIISGGETTVKVSGDGLGGRNMEFALLCADLIKEWKDVPVLFASLGSDGTDGPTDAAGAVATPDSVERGNRKGLNLKDYAERNDSYHYFQALDDLIITGPTRTNVMDFRFVLIG
jgi:hydroxypyruvate reductase